MNQEKLLTVREVAEELGINEGEVVDLAETGKLPAYKIGGVYLRFKVEQVRQLRQEILKSAGPKAGAGFWERLRDFFYFNDFYIFSFLILVLMAILIFLND